MNKIIGRPKPFILRLFGPVVSRKHRLVRDDQDFVEAERVSFRLCPNGGPGRGGGAVQK